MRKKFLKGFCRSDWRVKSLGKPDHISEDNTKTEPGFGGMLLCGQRSDFMKGE